MWCMCTFFFCMKCSLLVQYLKCTTFPILNPCPPWLLLVLLLAFPVSQAAIFILKLFTHILVFVCHQCLCKFWGFLLVKHTPCPSPPPLQTGMVNVGIPPGLGRGKKGRARKGGGLWAQTWGFYPFGEREVKKVDFGKRDGYRDVKGTKLPVSPLSKKNNCLKATCEANCKLGWVVNRNCLEESGWAKTQATLLGWRTVFPRQQWLRRTLSHGG